MVRPSALPASPRPRAAITRVVCPYLLSADGGWRASSPTRDHRCTAVSPAAILALEKQRRLCLAADHISCATYVAASESMGGTLRDGAAGVPTAPRASAREVVRTTPVVLDHGRMSLAMPVLRRDPRLAQASLIGLMVLAFAAILLARSPAATGPRGSEGAAPIVSPTTTTAPAGSAEATRTTAPATAAPGASAVPTRTLVPTEAKPSANTTGTPKPATAGTYKVKRGDTLSGIATAHGTTWQVLAELNHISDPARLHVGQILQLP